MHFTPAMLLSLNCLVLWHPVEGSSRYSILSNDTSVNESIASVSEIFFLHFKKAYIKKYNPRFFTVVGSFADNLCRASEFFENYPHIVYAKRNNRFIYSEERKTENLVVIFLDELANEIFIKMMKFLSHCTLCKVLFASEKMILDHEIQSLFVLTGQRNVGYVQFAVLERNVVKLYGKFMARNCSMEVRLIGSWSPGNDLDAFLTWKLRVRDYKGCPVSVSTSSFEPKMMIEKTEDGQLIIAGGIEGELVLVVAEKLNFTLQLRSPSTSKRLKYSRKASIVQDVVSEEAEIGIGRLRPTNDIDESLVFSVMYDDECITWGVPRIMNWSHRIIFVEFTPFVWSLVGLTFVVGFTAAYIFKKVNFTENGARQQAGSVAILLDIVSVHLGSPVVDVPSTGGGRFMLMAFLYYATVVVTAYKTSLASILTTEKGTPAIVNAEGILRENLSIGGSFYDFSMLKDQVNYSETTGKLVERFVVNNNDSHTLYQLKTKRDFAFLARGSSLHEEKYKSVKSLGSTTFDVLESCVLSYHTVMVIREKSYLQEPINHVIRRLWEAGITQHWDIDKFDTDKILNQRNIEKFSEKRAWDKVERIFLCYLCCIAFCVMVFCLELITPRLVSKKFHPAIDTDFQCQNSSFDCR